MSDFGYVTQDDVIDEHLRGSHDDLPEDGCVYCRPTHHALGEWELLGVIA